MKNVWGKQNSLRSVSIRLGLVAGLMVSLLSFVVQPSAQAAFPGTDFRMAYGKLSGGEGGMAAALTTNSLASNDEQTIATSAENGFVGPRFSADGQRVTYSELSFSDGSGNVYASDADGTNVVNISNINPAEHPDKMEYKAMYSSLSADGSKVVYGGWWRDANTGDTLCHIFMANSDGTNQMQLTNTPDLCDMYPVFSPNGQKIAFIRTSESEDVGVNSIYIMDVDGTNAESLYVYGGRDEKETNPMQIMMAMTVFDGGQTSPIDWSPDGSRILFSEVFNTGETTYTTRVGTVDLSGASQGVIVNNVTLNMEEMVMPVYGHAQFTPSGKIIFKELIITNPESEESASVEQYIRLADGNGSNVTQLLYQDVTTEGGGFEIGLLNYGLPTVYSAVGSEPEGGPTAAVANPENGKQVTLSSDACDEFTGVSAAKEASAASQDDQYQYPTGLVNYTLTDCGVGGSATVTLVFEDVDPDGEYVARKLNSATGTYTTISGATISATTVSGQPATQLRYVVTDGGELDMDGEANGTIVDPVGLGVLGATDGGAEGSAGGGNLADSGAMIVGIIGAAVVVIGGAALTMRGGHKKRK
ncbi:hypothetical protein E6P97_01815 [Patescibacteria group bacterium]|nr:MAG: hypothetical protein E6P97_01815 [Patescibacteria group bacterium]